MKMGLAHLVMAAQLQAIKTDTQTRSLTVSAVSIILLFSGASHPASQQLWREDFKRT